MPSIKWRSRTGVIVKIKQQFEGKQPRDAIYIKPEWFYDGVFPFIERTEFHRLVVWFFLLAITALAIILALIEDSGVVR